MTAIVHYLPPASALTCRCGFAFKTAAAFDSHNRAVHEERPSLTPEENLRRAREMLHRLDGFSDAPGPEAGDGVCDDCGNGLLMRLTVGRFAVCRACAASRRRVRPVVVG